MSDVRPIILPSDRPSPGAVLSSLLSNDEGALPDFVRADGESLALIIADPSSLGDGYVARPIPDGTTMVLAVGEPDAPCTGGTFNLAYGNDSTYLTDIPVGPTAGALENALNRNPTRLANGPVTVTASGYDFIVADTTVGARQSLTGDGSQLVPLGSVEITVLQAGTAASGGNPGTAQILLLSVTQTSYALQTDYAALPTAAGTVATFTAGSVSAPAVQIVTLDPPPYGGYFGIDGKLIPWDASETEFAAAYGVDPTLVLKIGTFAWQYTRPTNGVFVSTAVDVSKLMVPTGFLVTLNLSTFGFLRAFSQSTVNPLVAQIAFRVTFPGQLPKTFLIGNVSVFRSVIETNNLVSAAVPGYPSAAAVQTAVAQAAAATTALATLRGFTLHTFSDNAAKLASNVPVGDYAEISGEGNRIEQYLGPISGLAGSGCSVTGAGFEAVNFNGIYYTDPTVNGFTSIDGTANIIPDGAGGWLMYDNADAVNVYQGSASSHPSLATWSLCTPGVGGSLPVVFNNDVASDANWVVLRNTVNLAIYNDSGTDATIVGVVVGSGGYVNVGWVDPLIIPVSPINSFQAEVIFITHPDGTDWTLDVSSNTGSWGSFGTIPCPLPPRCNVTVYLESELY